ncbi:hypothetical protein [Paenibacillus tundrae]|uniref:hypothetical protein n=1 Tax=Paenibacillus tundrae TaxID=528187 RepID=UPI0027D8274B|nr:hypothetical protein [Paenibacillus tundrae]
MIERQTTSTDMHRHAGHNNAPPKGRWLIHATEPSGSLFQSSSVFRTARNIVIVWYLILSVRAT